MALTVSTKDAGDAVVVALRGELDIYTVAEFRHAAEGLLEAGRLVVLDLGEVTLLDSSGIGVLVSMLNRTRAGSGRMGIVCPVERLQRVFEITGLRDAFVLADDLEGVRAAFA